MRWWCAKPSKPPARCVATSACTCAVRFSTASFAALHAEEGQRITTSPDAGPIVEAARFALAGRREAERATAQLRRALDEPPVVLPQLFGEELGAADLGPFADLLGPVVLDHHRHARRHVGRAGRARDERLTMDSIDALLRKRLVVCVGCGGVGKTTTGRPCTGRRSTR